MITARLRCDSTSREHAEPAIRLIIQKYRHTHYQNQKQNYPCVCNQIQDYLYIVLTRYKYIFTL